MISVMNYCQFVKHLRVLKKTKICNFWEIVTKSGVFLFDVKIIVEFKSIQLTLLLQKLWNVKTSLIWFLSLFFPLLIGDLLCLLWGKKTSISLTLNDWNKFIACCLIINLHPIILLFNLHYLVCDDNVPSYFFLHFY